MIASVMLSTFVLVGLVFIWPAPSRTPVKISISSPYPTIVPHPEGPRQKVTLRARNLPNLQVKGAKLVNSSLLWTSYEHWDGNKWAASLSAIEPVDVSLVDSIGLLKYHDKWDPGYWKVVRLTPGKDDVEFEVNFPLGAEPFRLRFQVFRQATMTEKIKNWFSTQRRIKPWRLTPLPRSALVPDYFVYTPPLPRPEDVDDPETKQ